VPILALICVRKDHEPLAGKFIILAGLGHRGLERKAVRSADRASRANQSVGFGPKMH
jgi:hypothetical protein